MFVENENCHHTYFRYKRIQILYLSSSKYVKGKRDRPTDKLLDGSVAEIWHTDRHVGIC